jgi:hypothetical protein
MNPAALVVLRAVADGVFIDGAGATIPGHR